MKGWPPSATFDQTVTLNTVDERIRCTMILAGAQSRAGLSEDDPVNHDAQSRYITFSVIDPDTGRPVPYGERGQVVMNHISKIMFVPNNLERDTVIRAQRARWAIRSAKSNPSRPSAVRPTSKGCTGHDHPTVPTRQRHTGSDRHRRAGHPTPR